MGNYHINNVRDKLLSVRLNSVLLNDSIKKFRELKTSTRFLYSDYSYSDMITQLLIDYMNKND